MFIVQSQQTGKHRQKLQQAMSAFSAAVSWAMEILLSCGLYEKPRLRHNRPNRLFYHFEKRDGIVLAVLSLLLIGLVPHLKGWIKWEYYPL